jgi:hypothetical protein
LDHRPILVLIIIISVEENHVPSLCKIEKNTTGVDLSGAVLPDDEPSEIRPHQQSLLYDSHPFSFSRRRLFCWQREASSFFLSFDVWRYTREDGSSSSVYPISQHRLGFL